jgi:hypothetical protein
MNFHNEHKFSLYFLVRKTEISQLVSVLALGCVVKELLFDFQQSQSTLVLKYLTLFHSPGFGPCSVGFMGLSLGGESLLLSLRMSEVTFPFFRMP